MQNRLDTDAAHGLILARQLAGLKKLVEITGRLAQEIDHDRILNLVTAEVPRTLDCERASLFLYDSRRDELYTKVVTELEIQEIRLGLEQGIMGRVGRTRQMANVSDPASDRHWNSTVDRCTGFQTRSLLAVPLVSPHDGKLLGVLEALNKHGHAFDSNDEQMLQAFADNAAIALERAGLLEHLRQTRELEGALDAARNIQRGFLPEQLPDIDGYELAAWWQPAQGVGGDYYDVVRLPDSRFLLAVADVSGHGLGPSLIMASARAMLHVLARTVSDPARMLTLLSDTIYPDLQDGRFITFCLAALDISQHTVTFANAGHGPAFHLSRGPASIRTLETTGLPIGIEQQIYPAAQAPVNVAPGDLVILATDGAIELKNAEGEMFGRPRLEQLVLQYQALPARELLAKLKSAILEFSRCEHLEDDITVLILERKMRDSE